MIDLAKIQKRIKSKTEFLGCRADTTTSEWLKRYCIERKVSVSGVILELVKALQKDEESKTAIEIAS